jgi:hypothetical protein
MIINYIKVEFSAILVCVGLSALQAQEVIPVTGGDAVNKIGSISYTLGQIFYPTLTGTNGSLVEGVQQPYEISIITGLEEAKGIELSIWAYPNPVTNYLKLRIDELEITNLYYRLYDTQGKLLQSKRLTENETIISVINLSPAIYFMKIIKKDKEIKTFKIIKNNRP